ncbi:MAG: secretin N-terminal domain-containing protein [bacterium]
MKKLSVLLSLFMVAQTSLLFGQLNQVMGVSYSEQKGDIQCRIVCKNKVPFGSIWLPDKSRLVVYVRNSRWAGEKSSIEPADGPVSRIHASQSKNDGTVTDVTLDFRSNRKYAVNYDGNDIVVSIENRNPLPQKNLVAANERRSKNLNRIEKRYDGLYDSFPINMDYNKAELSNVLRLLAQQNNVNIVAGSAVTGNITISLRNVTLKEALDNILLANNYDYVVDDNIILVKPQETYIPSKSVTRVFRLKYIDAYNLMSVVEGIVSATSKLQVFAPEFYSHDTGDKGKEGAGPAKANQEKEKRRSSVLIVTDSPEVIDKIEALIEQLDVPTPQILIESKLVELSPLDKSSLGIDWDKSITASLFYQELLPGGDTQDYSVVKEDLTTAGPWVLGHLTASQFSSMLNFLRQTTESKLVSNPKILAMDNQTSTITVGTTFPIPQINRGVAGQGDIVTFQYKDVNIELNVTPHVTENDEIIMYVNPVIEEITGEVIIDINRAPITSKRSVSTVVSVKDGETIVIGGMIKEDMKKTVSKVFLLGQIPLLGNLFRNTDYEKKQSDLLIFITPHIIQ